MDHIVDTSDDTPRQTGAEGFAALWSDMPRDVMESVHLHGRVTTHARLTMQAPSARVEISIAPHAKAQADVPAPHHGARVAACGDAPPKTQEKDQNP